MSGRTDPPAAFQSASLLPPARFDPVRLCVYSTICLLALLLTPALLMTMFSGVALVAYSNARRRGLAKSKCKLGDTRLVMTYLGLLFIGGTALTVYRVIGLLS